MNEERRDERSEQEEKHERKSIEDQNEGVKRINAFLSAMKRGIMRGNVVRHVVRVMKHRVPILGRRR